MKRQNRVTFFNFLSILLLRGISLISMPLFTRLLGDAGYGVSSYYFTWTSALAIVLTLQTESTLVNARVEYPEEEQRRYQSSVMALSVLTFLTGSAVILCCLGPIARLLKMDQLLIIFMLVQAFGTYCVNFLSTRFVYEFKAGRNMALSLAVSLLTMGLSVLFIVLLPQEVNYYGRITAVVTTYALLGVPACILILAQGRTFYRPDFWKFCVVLAIPGMFHNLSDLVLGQSDRVMVRQFSGDAALGRYAAALNFGGILFTIFQALDNSWRPFFFDDLKAGDLEQVHDKAVHFQELMTVLSLGFLLLTREVYRIFVPAKFWETELLIPVFVTGYYLNFLCTFPVNFEYYHKQTKIVAAVTIFCSLVNVGLNYILIRAVGIAGAALATMASHSLQLGLHYLYCRCRLGGKDYPFGIRMWWKGAAIYACGVALVYVFRDLWLLRWGLGAAIGMWELLRIKKRKVII